MTDYKIVSSKDIDNNRINSTISAGGRFGNIFIRNIITEFIAIKNNLKIKYEKYDEINNLGIKLFIGDKIYEDTLVLVDNIIDNIIFNDELFDKYAKNKNIFFYQDNYNPFNHPDRCWCQTSSTVSHVRNIINCNQDNVKNKNPYKDKYNNNNDLFVHVRLGDIIDFKFFVDYKYYDDIISKLSFDKGYISSDSIDHEICQKLIKKYNLIPYNSDEITTIQFGSVCKNIVLSHGTFSLLIGLFGYNSIVYFPKVKIKWHGNIFIFPDWNEIDY